MDNTQDPTSNDLNWLNDTEGSKLKDPDSRLFKNKIQTSFSKKLQQQSPKPIVYKDLYQ